MQCYYLVVGGGPAGATVARILAREGREVVLLERDLKGSKPCGGGIPSTAFTELEIPLQIPHRQVQSLRIVSPSGRNLRIDLEGGSLITVRREDLDRYLRELSTREGAEVLEGTLLDLERGKGEVTSTVILNNGRRINIKSRYLIGADGVNSRVRRLLGLGPVRSVYTISTRVAHPDGESCEFWFGNHHARRFYSWVFPSVGFLSVGTGTMTPREAGLLLKRFLQKRGLHPLNALKRGYRIPIWQEGPLVVDRILLVGDAAGQVMPFTYEGLYYAMTSAVLAAEALIKERPSLYTRLWRKRFYSRFRFMGLLAERFLKRDSSIERLFDIFQRPPVQKASMRLWLHKDHTRGALLSYINLFRKMLI